MLRALARPAAVAIGVAILLAAAGFVQLRGGPDAAPAPVLEILKALFGYEPDLAAKLLVGLQFALAAAVFAVGKRPLTDFASGLVAFIALACVSRALRDGGLVLPSVAFVAAIALLFASSAVARIDRAEPASVGRRGLSPGWSFLGALGVFTAASSLTASLAFGERQTEQAEKARARAAETPAQTTATIDLDMRQYLGKSLLDTPLPGYIPGLADLVGTNDAFLVFYNPSCETCHTVFREHFNLPRAAVVVAIEIPQADGAIAAAGDGIEDIECAQCERLTLPQGPNWMIAPPMTVRIRGGAIECVADRFGGDCFSE